jgi:hypothetical protein
MDSDDHTARNADELSRRLGARRRALAAATSDDHRARAAAVAQFDAYVNLLRQTPTTAVGHAPAPSKSTMLLKLEFEDGRWDVAERELEEVPRVGDNVCLSDGRMSRVRAIQTVLSGRSNKPPRKIVVCTLFA